MSLGGLTVGQQYQIQILTGSADGNRTFDFYHTGWDNPGTNVLVDQGNVGPNSSDLAEIYTVVFTTDDGNALFGLKRTAATSQPVLNAYVLSAVPEPSGMALLGLGLLTLAGRRRR